MTYAAVDWSAGNSIHVFQTEFMREIFCDGSSSREPITLKSAIRLIKSRELNYVRYQGDELPFLAWLACQNRVPLMKMSVPREKLRPLS